MFSDPTCSSISLLLILTTYCAVGLLAVWAALGRSHWCVRFGLLGAALLPGVLAGAHELVVNLFLECVVVVGVLTIDRWLRARAEKGTAASQFSLLDLLLLTALVAVAVAAGASIPVRVWTDWGLSPPAMWNEMILPLSLLARFRLGLATLCLSKYAGIIVGGLAVAAVAVVFGKARPWMRAIGFCVFFPCAPMAIWLMLLRCSGWLSTPVPGPTQRSRLQAAVVRPLFVLASLAMSLPPLWMYYLLLTPPPIPEATLPNPNGYDTLVRVAEQVSAQTVPDKQTATPAQLRSFANKCQAMLDTAHAALDQPCQVPVKYDLSDIDVYDVMACRDLARAFVAEGALAEADGDRPKAVGCYFDAVRLGQAFAREGLAIHLVVGYAVEREGLQALHEISGSLTRRQCQKLSVTLRDFETQCELPDVTWIRERAWMGNAPGWADRLQFRIESAFGIVSQGRLCVGNAFNYRQAVHRVLQVELALANYRLEHGEYPKRLAELVPEYIDVLPEDPFSGKTLVYRLTPKGYLLYSVGLNGVDEGGQTLNTSPDADDVRFE